MSAHTQTTDISPTGSIIDVPVILAPDEMDEMDEIPPVPEVKTQKASQLLKELESEEATKFHIAPIGLNNFLYNAAHLFLPYFYSSRAYVVLRSATSAEEEIRSKFTEAASKDSRIALQYWPHVKESWTEFLNSLSNEWKTLNVVSALLLTAIYNVLQLGGRGNGLTQSTALMSLLSALMSLLFGCLYLIRFETMRRTYKAIQWSSDVLETSQAVFWNIYILLALPSVWLAWSLIFFVACLMSIVWQPIDETIRATSGLGSLHLATKIAVSALLFVGMAHLSLALFTFARYGSRLGKAWTKKLESFSGVVRLADVEATSKSSSFEGHRPAYSGHLLFSNYPLWPSPYTAMVGNRKPFNNVGRPPNSHLLSPPYPLLPSSYAAMAGGPFDNGNLPYAHLLSSPYPLLPSPYTTTIGGPSGNDRPPYAHLHSSPYAVPPGRPFYNNGSLYSLLPYSSPYGPYSIGRPSNNSRPLNNSQPFNYSRPLNENRLTNNSRPIAHSRSNNNSGHNNGPVRHTDFITRPLSVP